ncbi:MAG: DUF4215 domain-containing protein [Streptococcus sp.]|nr:DUF4215 domain-containing protein [Streptococcus sp.]
MLNEAGFICKGAIPDVCTAICGDGKVVGVEVCDDANAVDGLGCLPDCSGMVSGYSCTI